VMSKRGSDTEKTLVDFLTKTVDGRLQEIAANTRNIDSHIKDMDSHIKEIQEILARVETAYGKINEFAITMKTYLQIITGLVGSGLVAYVIKLVFRL